MDRVKPSPRTDLITGAALFILALVYGFGARGLTASGDPGVAFVPIGLAAALALLSGRIALSGWRRLRRPDDDAGPTPLAPGVDEGGTARDAPEDSVAPDSTRASSVIGLTVLYAALFQTLGYVVATLLYTAAVADRFGAKRRTILVLVPCVTLLTYLLFRVILGARLPEGILG